MSCDPKPLLTDKPAPPSRLAELLAESIRKHGKAGAKGDVYKTTRDYLRELAQSHPDKAIAVAAYLVHYLDGHTYELSRLLRTLSDDL